MAVNFRRRERIHDRSNRSAGQARPASEDRLDVTWQKARDALLRLQNEKGYWVGELQGDSILASEYLLLKFILGAGKRPRLAEDRKLFAQPAK